VKHDRVVFIRQRKAKALLPIDRVRYEELANTHDRIALALPDSSNLLSGASFGVRIASGDRAQKELAASSAPAIGFSMSNSRAARAPGHPRTAGGAQGVHSANHLPL
jgi:hypothetical protein